MLISQTLPMMIKQRPVAQPLNSAQLEGSASYRARADADLVHYRARQRPLLGRLKPLAVSLRLTNSLALLEPKLWMHGDFNYPLHVQPCSTL